MSDPVAAKSGFLCMYMSNHPDTLVLYATYFGKVSAQLESAKMTAIDTNGMTLVYTTKSKKEGEVRVLFDPPLAGYEEVKPRLLSMRADADENLGLSSPTINTIAFIPEMRFSGLPILALLTTTYASTILASPILPPYLAPLFGLFAKLHDLVGAPFVAFSWWLVIVLHGLEALWMTGLCYKYRAGLVAGTYYVGMTLLFGLPAILNLRKRAQVARIDAIMKGK